MLSFTHTLISLPFAVYLQNPVLIFLSAFAFHLFADTLPHWNLYPEQLKRYFIPLVPFDIASGLFAAFLLFGSDVISLPVLTAIAGGNMPDILQGFWELTPRRLKNGPLRSLQPLATFHERLQSETYSVTRGVVSQIILAILALALIFIY